MHSTRGAFEADRSRQNKLVVAGWLPVRFTWLEAQHSADDMADQVQAALLMRRPAS